MIWRVVNVELGTLCKGVIFDLLVSPGRSVSQPVITDAEGRWVSSRTLTPSLMQTIDCVGKSDGYHGKPDGLSSMCFVLVGKCLCLNVVPASNVQITSCFFLFHSISLQPCTEVLFLDIFHNYSQTLTPVLLEMVQNLQGWFYLMCLWILYKLYLGLEIVYDSFSTLIVIGQYFT